MSNVTETAIWRDGDRLVSHECGGFIDTVPDANLERYAADEASHPLDRAFAAAVLSIRKFERLAFNERVARFAATGIHA
jgi:hypothetical protein